MWATSGHCIITFETSGGNPQGKPASSVRWMHPVQTSQLVLTDEAYLLSNLGACGLLLLVETVNSQRTAV